MIKKVINYTDYNGNDRQEIAYFNLDENELFDMNLQHEDGYESYFKAIIEAQDRVKLIGLIKEVMDLSYGKKSGDGRKFEKSPEILADFKATPAYGQLYMDLLGDADVLGDFMNGIISASVVKKYGDQIEEEKSRLTALVSES